MKKSSVLLLVVAFGLGLTALKILAQSLQFNATQTNRIVTGTDFEPLIAPGTTSQYFRGDKTWQTLPSPGTGTVTSIIAGTGLSGGTITTSGTISLPNVGTAGTYSGVTTDAQGRVTSATTRSFSAATRSMNTAFQISSTRDVLVSYAVDVAATISLTSGQSGTVTLEYADDSGLSTNLVVVNQAANGNTGSLTVGINLTQTATATVSGVIPAGKYVKLLTTNNTGTPTYTFKSGQEVSL